MGDWLTHVNGTLNNPGFTAPRPSTNVLYGLGMGPSPLTPMSDRNSYYGPAAAPGMLAPGNIDLFNRPQVRNEDGSISTLHSISIDENGHSVLIPTVIGNQVVPTDAAVAHYKRTGQHLGKFSDFMAADAHSQRLHLGQARRYQGQPMTPATSPLLSLFGRR